MKEVRGIIMIIGAAVLWGVSATGAKALLNRSLDPVLVVQSRVTFSVLLLLLYFLIFRPSVLRVRWTELWKFALLGCIGVAGTNFTYYFTIRESTVATAILIQYTAPLFVMLYAVWSKEERLSRHQGRRGAPLARRMFPGGGAYDRSAPHDHTHRGRDGHRIDRRVRIPDHLHAVRSSARTVSGQ